MLSTIRSFVEAIQQVLSIDHIRQTAKDTKFIQRQRGLKAEDFLNICAFLSYTPGEKSLDYICGAIAQLSNRDLSKQALDQRFTSRAVDFLKTIFLQLAEQQAWFTVPIQSSHPFKRIRLLDATSFHVPQREPHQESGAKIQLEYELLSGQFIHTLLQEMRASDQDMASQLASTILPGDLILRDLGYFSGEHLQKIDQEGGYYITRVPSNQTFWTWDEDGKKVKLDLEEDGEALTPGETQDYGVIQIGKKGKNIVQTRVVVQRLTEEQQHQRQAYLKERRRKGGHTQSANKRNHIQILATNVTQEQLDAQELYPFYSLRWQVEILFKTWKSIFHIDHVRHLKPERLYCHLYGTLIHILLSSMITFQCRYYLHQKYQMEISEYKCIYQAKQAIELTQGNMLYHFSSFVTNVKKVFQVACRHARKDHRKRHTSPFDILYISYKETVSTS
ncbi:IS4 family transposase [Gracilibacillus massiliensis]|uniref:IS4 family transposase n=1 Tax=Gracilibacillus massiliensis TaxID=1564956 RepID=UPI00071E027F|nr:IS4 family transposase [Gracilibacillus massiliensis]